MRIISLVPSVTETLFELDLEDSIVAVTRFCRFPTEGVRRKLKVGGTKNPHLDSILELRPDIVIMNMEENRKEDADYLQQHGIPLHITFPNTMREAARTVLELGDLFNRRDRAARISEEIEKRLKEYVPLQIRKSLILIWQDPYMTANRTTYVHDVCRFFGFDNVFAENAIRYPELTSQEIKEANPEVILFPDEPFPFVEKHVRRFEREFKTVNAVVRRKLFSFSGTYLTWHGYGTLRTLLEFPELIARTKILL